MPLAAPKPFGGKDLRVHRKSGASTYDQLCMITTSKVNWTYEYDDASTANPTTPGAVVLRRSIQKMQAWSCNISGICDISDFALVKGDADSGAAVEYKFEAAVPLADGGGFWLGNVFFENLEIGHDKFGTVTFTGQLRGDGALAWTPASA